MLVLLWHLQDKAALAYEGNAGSHTTHTAAADVGPGPKAEETENI
jgi:hypothetical protein